MAMGEAAQSLRPRERRIKSTPEFDAKMHTQKALRGSILAARADLAIAPHPEQEVEGRDESLPDSR